MTLKKNGADDSQTTVANKIGNCLGKCITPIYGIMMSVIIIICIFFSNINFAGSRNKIYLPAIIQLIMGSVFVCGFFSLCKRLNLTNKLNKKHIIITVSLIVFLAQVYFVWNYYFYTDWDVPRLINLSDAVAHGGDVSGFSLYFSTYPNNLFLAFVFSVIRRIAHFVGLHEHEYFVILCVQCLLNTATGFFLAKVLDKLFDNINLSFLGYLMYFMLIGISPWVSIPYSDSMGLLFPILILDIYINRKNQKKIFVPWLEIAILSFIGYKIKPQIFIVFIAILMVECINIFKEKKKIKKDIFRRLAAVIIGIVCAGLVSQAAVSSMNFYIDKNKTFNMQHFLMMGMNPDTMGVYSGEDVGFSMSFETADARDKANMDMALERIKNMGIVGVSKQLVRKTLTNYYDGTFCWGGEGSFFLNVLEEKNTPICSFARSLYYTRSLYYKGNYYAVWANFEQMIWLTVLLISIFSIFADKSSDKEVIMLAIIGLTLFELIFEARARYLYTYVPLYIVLAIYGVSFISRKVINRDNFRAVSLS